MTKINKKETNLTIKITLLIQSVIGFITIATDYYKNKIINLGLIIMWIASLIIIYVIVKIMFLLMSIIPLSGCQKSTTRDWREEKEMTLIILFGIILILSIIILIIIFQTITNLSKIDANFVFTTSLVTIGLNIAIFAFKFNLIKVKLREQNRIKGKKFEPKKILFL